MNTPTTFKYRWWWKASPMRPIDRRGQACRILVRSLRMNSVLVEFLDGFKVITSRHAVRSYFKFRATGAGQTELGLRTRQTQST